MTQCRDGPPADLLAEGRELLEVYGDQDYGQESHTRLRADAEATVARWVWAKAGSQLHRIEPFARELDELPEPELVAEPPTPAANLEHYGYDACERIVWVRTHGDGAELWGEEFLVHEEDQITSIEFDGSTPPRRRRICRWRWCGGRVGQLIEAFGSGSDGSVSVTSYRYAGKRVECVSEQRFELPGGERSDQVITPTYAPDGRLLELRRRLIHYDPFSQTDFVAYRPLPEDLPDLPSQCEALARRLTEAISGRLIAVRPPDTLYGVVLEYGYAHTLYVSPLFEVARRVYLLAAAEEGAGEAEAFDAVDMWRGAEPEEYLPAGEDPAPFEPRVMQDAVWPFDNPELAQALETYRRTAALAERDMGYGAMDALWREVAARLTGLDWDGLLDSTEDFVVLAYPIDPGEEEVRDALKHSLPPERYAEFEANGWIPHDDELAEGDELG